MTRRELVKAAIAHQDTPRVPYFMDLTGEAWKVMEPLAGGKTCDAFLDNDVQDVGVPLLEVAREIRV